MVALIDVIYVSIQLSEQRINLHLNGHRSTNEIDLLLSASSDSACTKFSSLFLLVRFCTISSGCPYIFRYQKLCALNFYFFPFSVRFCLIRNDITFNLLKFPPCFTKLLPQILFSTVLAARISELGHAFVQQMCPFNICEQELC